MLTLSLRFETSTVIFKIPKNSFLFQSQGKFKEVFYTFCPIETDRIRTADRDRTGFSRKSGQKRDKGKIRTGLCW